MASPNPKIMMRKLQNKKIKKRERKTQLANVCSQLVGKRERKREEGREKRERREREEGGTQWEKNEGVIISSLRHSSLPPSSSLTRSALLCSTLLCSALVEQIRSNHPSLIPFQSLFSRSCPSSFRTTSTLPTHILAIPPTTCTLSNFHFLHSLFATLCFPLVFGLID